MDERLVGRNTYHRLFRTAMYFCGIVTVLSGITILCAISLMRLSHEPQSILCWALIVIAALSASGTYIIAAWAFHKARQRDINPHMQYTEREKKIAYWCLRMGGINTDEMRQYLMECKSKV